MYSISDELRQRFEQGERKTARVTIGNYAVDKTITEADIVSNGLSIDRYCVTGNKIEIGSAVAAELSLVLDNSSGKFDGIVFEGAQLFVEIGIAGDESSYIPCGRFTVDEPPRNNTRISLKALDYMMLFDNKADVSKLNFSNAEALVNGVCSECAVDLSSNVDFTKFANTNIELSEPTTEVTYRQLLQWACEILGVCAYMDGVGELMLAWYSDDINATFDPSVRYSGTMHEADIKISGVTIKKGDSDITKGTANDVVLIIENNQLIDGNLEKIKAIAEGVLAKTGGFTYRPFECSCLPMPYLYPLDKVAYTYKDKDGKDVSFYSVITNHTFGLNTTSSFAAKGETAQQKNYSKSKGVTKAEIDAAVAEAMKGVNLETDRFYVMYSAYPNGRLNGEENGEISWSNTAEADTQYLGTCVTSNKTQPGNPDEYNWVKIGGKNGAPATSYHMVVNTSVIKKDTNGVLSPMSVTFSAISQTGLEAPVSCKCCFKRYTTTAEDMSSWNLVNTVTNSTTSFLTSNIGDDVKAIRCTMYLNNSSTTVLDEQVVPIIRDGGEDAYTVILSNENHTFPGSNGKADKSSIDCHIEVYKGSTRLKTQITKINDVDVSGNTEVTSISGFKLTPHNNSEASDNNYVTIEASPTSTNTLTSTNGTIMFTISADGQTFTKDFSYSVVFNGEDGAPSTIYSVLPSVNAIVKDKKNQYNPASLTVSAKKQVGNGAMSDYSGRFHIETTTNMSVWDDTDGKGYESSTNQSSCEFALPDGIKAVRCSLHLAGQTPTSTNLLDQQVIPVVADGTDGDGKDAYTVILSNENHTFVGDDTKVLGTQTTTCDVIAYKGATQQKVTLGTAVLPTGAKGITVSPSNSGTTSAMLTIRVDSTLSPLSGSVSIPVTLEGGEKFTKTFSYSVALKGDKGDDGKDGKDGQDGAAATSYSMILSAHAIVKSISGVYTPSSITLTGKSQTGANALVDYSGCFKIEATADMSTWTARYTTSNTNTYTYTIPSGIKALRCSMYLAGGTSTLLDQQIVPIVSDGMNGANGTNGTNGTNGINGADAYTIVLTNESHTFAGSTSAAIAGSTTCNVIAYKGGTQVAATIGTISGKPTGMSTSITNNSSTSAYFTVSVTSSMISTSGTLTVPITVDGKSFTKYFSYSLALKGTKGEDGKDGFDGVGISSTTIQYASSTSGVSAPSTGWQNAIPAVANGSYLWTKITLAYTNGEQKISYSVSRMGEDGEDAQSLYANCTSEASNQVKYATLSVGSISALEIGTTVSVKFANGNSYAAPYFYLLKSDGAGIGSVSYQIRPRDYLPNSSQPFTWDKGVVLTLRLESDYCWYVIDEANTLSKMTTSGLVVGNWSGDTLNNNVLIGPASVDIRNGTTSYASYGANLIELGKNSPEAVIKLCSGIAQMAVQNISGNINENNFSFDYFAVEVPNGALYLGSGDKVRIEACSATSLYDSSSEIEIDGSGLYGDITLTSAFTDHTGTYVSANQKSTAEVDIQPRTGKVELYVNYPGKNSTSLTVDGKNGEIDIVGDLFVNGTQMIAGWQPEEILYNGGATNSTVTLSGYVSSYNYIEIFFQDSNGELGGYTKLYKPNGKTALLSINEPSTNSTYIRSTRITINGNTITPDTSESNCIFLLEGGGISKLAGNQIYITRVVGIY